MQRYEARRKARVNFRSSPRKHGPRAEFSDAEIVALDSRLRGNERKRRQRFLRLNLAIFSSTAQTAAVSLAPRPLFIALM